MKLLGGKHQLHSEVTAASFYLGASTAAEGEFDSEDDIILDGHYVGKITTKGLVEVLDNAIVEADITARTVIITGRVTGNIEAMEKLEIRSSAIITGDISCRHLEIRSGALVNGHLSMRDN